MTDTQLEQAVKLKARRDKAYSLANEVYNYGLLRLDKDSLNDIFNELSEADNYLIRNVLTQTMNNLGNQLSEKLKNL